MIVLGVRELLVIFVWFPRDGIIKRLKPVMGMTVVRMHDFANSDDAGGFYAPVQSVKMSGLICVIIGLGGHIRDEYGVFCPLNKGDKTHALVNGSFAIT